MSVVKITPDLIENYEIVTHPKRSYSSGSIGSEVGSSAGGVTGSISLIPSPSKAVRVLKRSEGTFYTEDTFSSIMEMVSSLARGVTSSSS